MCRAADYAWLLGGATGCAVDRARHATTKCTGHAHAELRRREAGDARGRDRRRQPQALGQDHHARAARCPRGAGLGGSGLQRLRTRSAADMYVRTWTGFLYVALDAFSRRVVGWAMAGHRAPNWSWTLNMALWRRRAHGVIHHSDQGSQYTSIAFGARCKEAGVRPSTGSVGTYDNGSAKVSSRPWSASCWIGAHPRQGALGDLRVHRRVLQPTAPPLGARLPVAGRLRGHSPRGGTA